MKTLSILFLSLSASIAYSAESTVTCSAYCMKTSGLVAGFVVRSAPTAQKALEDLNSTCSRLGAVPAIEVGRQMIQASAPTPVNACSRL